MLKGQKNCQISVPAGLHYCTACKQIRSVSSFRVNDSAGHLRSRCASCLRTQRLAWYHTGGGRAWHKQWAVNHPATLKKAARKHRLKKVFGLDEAAFVSLLEAQGGACAICRRLPLVGAKQFNIDHDHKTNRIRGILCGYCNPALGGFQDDPDILKQAIRYLETH